MKLFFTLFFLLFITATAQAQAPFFQGKTITIVVGTKAGDAYDLYPRMLAEFMPKYIPGSPNIIIQNVPGAASMIAANQVYNVAKPDGLTLGAIYPALYFEQLTKKPEVKFDWTKFTWIGNPVTSNHLLYMRSDAPYKSMDDIRSASAAPKCGSNGITSTGYYLPKLMEETLGTKFDIVLGYQSGQDVDLAVERGEVVCRAFTITAYFAREPFISWQKRHFVNVLMQSGAKRDSRLKDAPTIYELMDKYKTDGRRQKPGESCFVRRRVWPPARRPSRRSGGPQFKILRDAFDKSVNDPALMATAEKRRLEMDPATGVELEALAKEVMAATPDVVQKMQKLLGQ